MKPIYIILIIVGILLILGIAVVINMIRKVKRKIQNFKNKIDNPISAIAPIATIAAVKLAQEAKNGGFDDIAPEVKSIGGATSTLLPKIQRDFPDFHNPDAEEAIKTFVIEYLNIKYGSQQGFIKSKTDKNINYNIQKTTSSTVSNITFNRIAIYDYKKSNDYATITYKVSVGFDRNGKRIETRYELDYTLQLKDDGIHTKTMTCNNCGGPLSTIDTVCPFCDVKIIKDTIMNWMVMKITEI